MSVTLMIGAVGILIVLILLGIVVYSRNKALARPSTFALGILLLQVGLFVLFFTGVLENGNIVIFDVVWWASIVSGLVFGIREYKRNIIVSVLLLLLTSVFTMFMLLIGSI